MVDAGEPQTVTLPNSITVEGSMSDDGLPNGFISGTWSWVSGPVPVTFENPNALTTEAYFTGVGLYVLRLTAEDGELSAYEEVTITVKAQPVSAIRPEPFTNVLRRGGVIQIPCAGQIRIISRGGEEIINLSCSNGFAAWTGSNVASGFYYVYQQGSLRGKIVVIN